MLKIVKRILDISGKYKKKLILSFVFSMLETSIGGAVLYAVFLALGRIISGTLSSEWAIRLTIMLSALLLLRIVFKYLEYRLQSGTGYNIVCDERLKLGDKLVNLSMGFFNNTDAGNISSVINNDLVFVENFAMNFISKITSSLITMVIIVVFLFILDWRVALIASIWYPVAFVFNKKVQLLFVKGAYERQEVHAKTSSIMLEYLQGLFIIRSFNMADRQESRLTKMLDKMESSSLNFEMQVLPYIGLYLAAFHIGTAGILAAAVWFFVGGTMALATALFFIIMIFYFYLPMEMIGLFSGIIRLMDTCLDRMQVLFDQPVMDSESRNIIVENYDVSFENVSFSYDKERIVLNNISFNAPERSMTAVVGPSGSGKSTLLNLIARFNDVDQGKICIGGIDIKEMKCSNILENVSAVFQQTYLFHDTVMANLRFGNPHATDAQVFSAARKARCHNFIMEMENEYETIIGEGGATLSGGERQRISIARAILKDAPIVLLDEVTANIDPENEILIQEAIDELVKKKTIFIVAHKLATIKGADQIIVLDENGMICETGLHDELLSENGFYSFLWEKSQKISHWSIEA